MYTYIYIYISTYLHIYIFTYSHIYIQIQVSHTYLHIKAEVTKEFAHDAPDGGNSSIYLYYLLWCFDGIHDIANDF